MAARQDQGLQIALIILIFLFILSAVAAYIGWKSYGESEQRVAELQKTELGDKNKQVSNYQTENEGLREMIGVGPNDNFDAVKTTYDGDMKKFGGVICDETRRILYALFSKLVAKERDDAAGREADAKNRTRT